VLAAVLVVGAKERILLGFLLDEARAEALGEGAREGGLADADRSFDRDVARPFRHL
jgi:hypothetical protein